MLLGGLAFTQEFRHGTATATYLGEPRRGRVLLAKWLSLTLASIVVTSASLAVSVPVGATRHQSPRRQTSPSLLSSGRPSAPRSSSWWPTPSSVSRWERSCATRSSPWSACSSGCSPSSRSWSPPTPSQGGGCPEAPPTPGYSSAQRSTSTAACYPPPLGGLLLLVYTAAAVTLAVKLTLQRDVL